MLVDELRLWLIIPKMISTFVFIFFGFKIKHQKKFLLNEIFFWAFLTWAIYNFIDCFSFTFAADSFLAFQICSIFWNIQKFLLITYALLVFNAVKVIVYGENKINDLKNHFLEISILIFSLSCLILFVPIKIMDEFNNVIEPSSLPPSGDFHVAEKFNGIGGFAAIIPFIYFIIASFHLVKILKSTDDETTKKRILMLIIGIDLNPIGMFYFVIRGLCFPNYTWLTSLIGQFFILMSPIFIYSSLRKPKEKIEKIELNPISVD
ncbi:hypothetical protein NEF87_000496 [Candidatus Lokiarchaeum ossiferum]|uniref:Histidine kinase N-terminal 7TM region domain-containing protein n=1 Tax=Candidatus Lokiarchaeum ossiferum TaxID=2951803 RepID=A0ABY6HLB3_9ARCH|nr:hypothetical protein NEF87_000496 [Candidatus Lokiarchaeum sp. B-35]